MRIEPSTPASVVIVLSLRRFSDFQVLAFCVSCQAFMLVDYPDTTYIPGIVASSLRVEERFKNVIDSLS